MKQHRRHEKLGTYLARRGYAGLEELVNTLGVSVSTVRRDLDQLEREGTIRRTRGGAIYLGTREHPLDYGARRSQFVAQKEAIGKAAAGLVQDGEAIILDGGTTTQEVARHLRGRPVQIVTNSLPAANLLRQHSSTEVIMLGGMLVPQAGVLVGPYAIDMVRALHVRVAIMGVAGIDQDGLYNAQLTLVELQQAMMASAEHVIVVADHSKFGRKSLVRVGGFGEVSRILTDDGLSQDWRDVLRRDGTTLDVVPEAGFDEFDRRTHTP